MTMRKLGIITLGILFCVIALYPLLLLHVTVATWAHALTVVLNLGIGIYCIGMALRYVFRGNNHLKYFWAAGVIGSIISGVLIFSI